MLDAEASHNSVARPTSDPNGKFHAEKQPLHLRFLMSDCRFSEEETRKIRAAMGSINVTAPPWARHLSDDQLNCLVAMDTAKLSAHLS